MRWADVKYKFNDFWSEFKKVKFGIIGLVMLLIFILLMIFEPYVVPFKEANERWRDISYWEDNPQNAPPTWVNFFTTKKSAITKDLSEPIIINDVSNDRIKKYTYEFTYNYDYAKSPTDIIFHFNSNGPIILNIDMIRPDGEKLSLLKKNIITKKDVHTRISLYSSIKDVAYKFAKKVDPVNSTKYTKDSFNPFEVLFAKKEANIIENLNALNGNYKFLLTITNPGAKGTVSIPTAKISGRVSGVFGTDSSKRDLWTGLVAGIKWAMLIGILTSVVSVIIGVLFGVVCAYFGGTVDNIMQRIFELFIFIPLLPLIIVISAIFTPNIWAIILLMCMFFWVGPVKTVRSIGLQIKEETYIEASKALGASSRRIIFKHMVPLLVPYSFASMALSVPGAIVFEATISILGLGDPTIVSWGQILQDAWTSGAVIQGEWWWIIPPGLMISLVGMTFAFIGNAMDKILMPKLKTR